MLQILFFFLLFSTGTYQQNNRPILNYPIENGTNLVELIQPSRKTENVTKQCGYSNPNGIGQSPIEVSSNETKYAEYPWIIAILEQHNQYSSNPYYQYYCAGSLIHPSIVLTSAKCVYQKNARDLIVRAGEWNLNDKLEKIPEQDQYISEIIIHDQYNLQQSINDIALVFLVRSFQTNRDVVNSICLPTDQMNFDYNLCTVTGWGKYAIELFQRPENFLKKVDSLSVINNGECQKKLRQTNKFGRNYQLNSAVLCATDVDNMKNICRFADDGAPLICKVHGHINRYYQAGIVSNKLDCDDKNPRLYANIPALRPWIDKVLKEKNIDFSSFTVDNSQLIMSGVDIEWT